MSHTVIRMPIVTDNTGVHKLLPVIVTDHGPLMPLVRYMQAHGNVLSHSSQTKLVQAVGLLLDFIEANHECFTNPTELFVAFVDRLYNGSIGPEGDDPSGLYWSAKAPTLVKQLVGALSNFSDWLEEHQGTTPLNPWREATRAEQRLAWAAWHHKKNRAFLKHTMGRETARLEISRARNVLLKKTPVIDRDTVKFFPDAQIQRLLFEGFIVPGRQNSPRIEERLNLRDILITMLLHFGGLRMSEPFHLYVHDVVPDPHRPEVALVRVYEPSLGMPPPDWIGVNGKPADFGNRRDYLRGKYQMLPRTDYSPTDSRYAGWKGNALNSNAHCMDVFFFPTWAGEVFWKLWKFYLAQRAQMPCEHPFAFVAADGRPYSIAAYKKAHRRAIERIGLIPAKALGTTPHGHRHAYGQRLADADIDAIFRKKALHHKSLESQVVYCEPDRQKLQRALQAAEERAGSGDGRAIVAPPDFLAHGFEDVDPLGLLSGPKKLLQRKR